MRYWKYDGPWPDVQSLKKQNAQHKDRPAVQLQAGELTFTLGCRAKAFIENNFLGRTL